MPQELSLPRRDNIHQSLVWFSIIAAPLAWAARLLVNYTIAGQHCAGAAHIDTMALPNGRITAILLIDLLAVLIAGIAGSIAYQRWRETRSEGIGGTHHLVQSGEGRARFLAMCGMLTSTLFGVAVIIDAMGTIIGPPC